MEQTALPVLTIAVPTFNRLATLRLLVTRLSEEFSTELGDSVELLICDNCSLDGTADFLKDLGNAAGMRVVRHDKNIGPVQNLLSCMELANSRYVWLIGDDDLPLRGSGMPILRGLTQYEPALMYLAPRWERGDLSRFEALGVSNLSFSPVALEKLALQSRTMITFLSSWIVDRHTYRKLPSADLRRFSDTSLPHMEWLFSLMMSTRPLLITSCPVILARAGNSGGYDVINTFTKQYNYIVRDKLGSSIWLSKFYHYLGLYCFLPFLLWEIRLCRAGNFSDETAKDTIDSLRLEYGTSVFVDHMMPWVLTKRPIVARGIIFLLSINSRIWILTQWASIFSCRLPRDRVET